MGAAVAGGVIACYQVGYGIAAFGAGPLQHAGTHLSTLFGYAAIVALVMGGFGFVVTRVPVRRGDQLSSRGHAAPAPARRLPARAPAGRTPRRRPRPRR